VLYNRTVVEAGGFRKVAIVRRNAEVNLSELQWDPAVASSPSFSSLVATVLGALAANNFLSR
jgi:hypothetical protein